MLLVCNVSIWRWRVFLGEFTLAAVFRYKNGYLSFFIAAMKVDRFFCRRSDCASNRFRRNLAGNNPGFYAGSASAYNNAVC